MVNPETKRTRKTYKEEHVVALTAIFNKNQKEEIWDLDLAYFAISLSGIHLNVLLPGHSVLA